ncbi:zinc transport system substrate-binding protein [Rhodopseudomonas julia]|uniref:High-affinity zinc uptake system protein ZnuA n=1 Tax=Rhodopseudomonas julia TaxID=200617 RepID=A0ABU0C7J2_9BRAD|nr:zinc ABC transporter substrate-binding protein ZnuA [Rhodopseudomonas julia]MDQ0326470.1 zinc transport system substrate-binding protein [Rhodopseudomonas julia]
MRKRNPLASLAQGLAAGLVLSWGTQAMAAAPDVAVSIKPVHSLVAAVMEGVGSPHLIVANGSPHDYALKPSDARALEGADIVFWVGPEIEAFLSEPLETIAPDAKKIALSRAPGVTLLPPREDGAFEPHDHGHDEEAGHDHEGEDHADDDHGDHDHADHGHEGEIDPHLWLDPENAKAMVNAIETELADVDPDNAATYARNADKTRERLDSLSSELSGELAGLKGKPFIVFHDAYQYFEKRFGLEAAGSVTVSPEVSPGAQRVSEIAAKIRNLGVVCVFAEPQFTPKLIAVVTEGTDAKSGVLDPLGADLEAGPDLYFELLQRNADELQDCLG